MQPHALLMWGIPRRVQACLAVFPLDMYLPEGHKNAQTRIKPLVGTFSVLLYVSFNNVPYEAGRLWS